VPVAGNRQPQPDGSDAERTGAWAGRIYMWRGCSLYLGRALDTTLHRHHAVQFCFCIDGDLKLRGSRDVPWTRYTSAIIAPDRPHEFDAEGGRVALFYLDPEYGGVAPSDGEHVDTNEFPPLGSATTEALRAVLSTHAGEFPVNLANELKRNFIESYALSRSAVRPDVSMDPRIEQALQIMRGLDDVKISMEELAGRVNLSVSRFGHLFSETTSLPFRRYLLWLRMQRGLRLLSDGSNLTDAAHGSGFSDSSHLSHTFRDMFGMSPTELVRYSEFIQAD
jgi:AraC-like DNA-binding protein